MATAKHAQTEDNAPSTVGLDESEFEWTNVHEEAPDQIIFEHIDDTYIGKYLGSEVITFTDNKGEDQEFTQLRFRDSDGLKVINAGYELREAFEDIEPETVTRIRLVKFVQIAGQQSPMKSYRVDTAKARA